MAHMLSELMEKFISIEQSGCLLFSGLASQADVPLKVKTIARVFVKEEERHISLYQRLKERISGSLDMEIDAGLNAKADKLADSLRVTDTSGLKDPRELLEFNLNFEKEKLVMILVIRNLPDALAPAVTDILDEIAAEERRYISNVEGYVR